MSEVRDPAIKLFGRTIPVQERRAMLENYAGVQTPVEVIVETGDGSGGGGEQVFHCDGPPVEKDFGSEEKGDDLEVVCIDEPGQTGSSSGLNDQKIEENPETNNQEENNAVEESKPSTTIEEEQAEPENGNDKVLKKPDKILPCPRCNSLDTKFCYYNNYNVNQPRHFCKNCQRYWTAGGTMRNVPVGAGRRKNKHSASHYRAIMISEGMAASRVDNIDANHHQVIPFSIPAARPLKPNGTVLKFGSESPLCESMASVLNLGDQAADKRNLEINAIACTENGEEVSCGSSVTSSACVENEIREDVGKLDQASIGGNNCCRGPVPPQLQCYAGAPWPYHWNPAWNNVAAMAGRCSSELVYKPENGGSHMVPWSSPPMVAAPAFCGPTVPFHIVPASYWGCMAGWPGGAWNVPWVGSGAVSPAVSCTSSSVCSGNGSPTLGKHSRDPSIVNEEKPEKCVWVPKTLRIDDPDEAARSSIWATLGIKPEGGEPLARGGMFKAFQPKKDSSNIIHIPEASAVLHANPAALSRSQAFQESA